MQLELELFRFINSLSGHNAIVDRFMIAMSHTQTWVIVITVCLFMSLRIRSSQFLSLIFASLLAMSISDFVSFEIIKPLVGRERPCWFVEGTKTILGRCGGSYGFTSNHAANAFAVWAVFARYLKPLKWQSQVILSLATIVAISRVYLGVHFVGDIVGGAILGISLSMAACALGLKSMTDKWAKTILNWY